MKTRGCLLTVMIVFIGCQLHAQTILSKTETVAIFTDSIKAKNGIKSPIRRAYTYNDKTGKYYLALSESIDSIAADNDTLHYTIKGTCLQETPEGLVKKWELNDHKRPDMDEESSIWFWTKLCEVKDLDGDGIVEPLIVYGSAGLNGTDDGRIKILLYYKGQKTAIRHQNSVLDDGRITDIDAAFYTLPLPIQQHIRKLMKTLADKNFAIFATNYEAKMNKKAIHIE
ncbi:hypothetical protein SAMN05428988_0843 [Chitinophaga sp. YR573]|nr:hypothetical protein SAMN05428988_0843 [Chitinophaga sp. YR573]